MSIAIDGGFHPLSDYCAEAVDPSSPTHQMLVYIIEIYPTFFPPSFLAVGYAFVKSGKAHIRVFCRAVNYLLIACARILHDFSDTTEGTPVDVSRSSLRPCARRVLFGLVSVSEQYRARLHSEPK
jgi:hypothetical protein